MSLRLRWLPLVLLGGAAAWGDVAADDAQRVQGVIDALRAGDYRTAVTKLGEGPQLDVLAPHPELVHVLCDRAFRLDRRDADAAARRDLATRIFSLATAANAAAPEDDRTRWALAEALVLRERAGERTGAAAWEQAADLLEKIHAGNPSDALPLAYAVSFLLEGGCTETDRLGAFAERSDALAKRARDAQKNSPTLVSTIATSQFWAARTLATSNRKIARLELRAGLDALQPFAARAKDLEIPTLYNDAVAFGRRSGLCPGEKFVVAPRTTLSNGLAFDVPVSSRFPVQRVAATEEQAEYDYVTEVGAEGERLRQVLFRRYAFNQRYTFENPVPVGGDNVRSLTQGLQAMSAARVFGPGASASTPVKRSISKSMDGYAFEVKGTVPAEASSKAAEPLHLYGFVVRGRNQACYAVLVYVYGKDDDLGPEMEALAASLREPDKQ